MVVTRMLIIIMVALVAAVVVRARAGRSVLTDEARNIKEVV